jgi:AraC-like DNA-binding protein
VGETLSHPAISLIVDSSEATTRALVRGVHTARLSKRLVGQGHVFGIAFWPAMFQPLWGASIARLSNRYVPLCEVLGPEVDARARAIVSPLEHAGARVDASSARDATDSTRELAGMVARAEQLVAALLPRAFDEAARLRDLVERMAGDRDLLTVEDVARVAELNVRSLQRLFQRYVGVTPKWVLQRYRLHEAAEQLKASSPPDLAALAMSLGYADQAHFTRDFTRVVGQTPRSFAQKLRR